jgi:hypothetical protein
MRVLLLGAFLLLFGLGFAVYEASVVGTGP